MLLGDEGPELDWRREEELRLLLSRREGTGRRSALVPPLVHIRRQVAAVARPVYEGSSCLGGSSARDRPYGS
jgi:hypothetical protein